MVVQIRFGIINPTGLFPEACQDWLLLPAASRIGENLMAHFNAIEAYCLEQKLLQQRNYTNQAEVNGDQHSRL